MHKQSTAMPMGSYYIYTNTKHWFETIIALECVQCVLLLFLVYHAFFIMQEKKRRTKAMETALLDASKSCSSKVDGPCGHV